MEVSLLILPSVHTRQDRTSPIYASVQQWMKASTVVRFLLNKLSKNMEQQEAKPVKTKSVSAMRKLTSELDTEVRKVETNKARLAKIEKTIAVGNDRIKALTAQLSKHFS